jgi:hypothetical protein
VVSSVARSIWITNVDLEREIGRSRAATLSKSKSASLSLLNMERKITNASWCQPVIESVNTERSKRKASWTNGRSWSIIFLANDNLLDIASYDAGQRSRITREIVLAVELGRLNAFFTKWALVFSISSNTAIGKSSRVLQEYSRAKV